MEENTKKAEGVHQVPKNKKELEELCHKVGIKKAFEIAGIIIPEDPSKTLPPPPPAN